MDINAKTRIGDIVKENFRTARVFEKNKIDFCCGGGISLEEACKKSEVDISELMPELESLVMSNDPDSKYINSLELDELCDYTFGKQYSF